MKKNEKPTLNNGVYVDAEVMEEIIPFIRKTLDEMEFDNITPVTFRNCMRVEKIKLRLQFLEDAIITLRNKEKEG